MGIWVPLRVRRPKQGGGLLALQVDPPEAGGRLCPGEDKQVVEPKLEPVLALDLPACPGQDLGNVLDFDSMVLFSFHAVEDVEADHHVENWVDNWRRYGCYQLARPGEPIGNFGAEPE